MKGLLKGKLYHKGLIRRKNFRLEYSEKVYTVIHFRLKPIYFPPKQSFINLLIIRIINGIWTHNFHYVNMSLFWTFLEIRAIKVILSK